MFGLYHRATAAGVLGGVSTLSMSAFLAMEPLFYRHFGSHYNAIPFMALINLFAPFLVFLLPESAGKKLDEVAPET